MKRFFLWILGVALGVILFVGALMGASWYFTGTADLPAQGGAAFGGAALSENGWCWQLPLLGAFVDKVEYSAPTLTVQNLGENTQARPALTLPEWANHATLTLTADTGETVFSGTAAAYAAFDYPHNGTYTAVLQAWHLPAGMDESALAAGTQHIVKSPGLETPAKPVGWYGYRFRFSLAAAPAVTLSAGTVKQGGTLCVTVSGLLGSEAPAAKTDLGTICFEKTDAGWRGYLGVAYNAETGVHQIAVTAGAQAVEAGVTVSGRQYGTAEVTPTEDNEAANTEFRNVIWPLYTAASGKKQWYGAWQCPVAYSAILLDYGAVKTVNGVQAGKSNSTLLATAAGAEVTAPAGGTVVYAGMLQLTGGTVVIDHGCGVRTFLYGLSDIYVSKGDAVYQNSALATAGDTVTVDVKIGSKSVCPWDLFKGSGGLFYQE